MKYLHNFIDEIIDSECFLTCYSILFSIPVIKTRNSRIRNKRPGTLVNFGQDFHGRHLHYNHPVSLNLKHFPPISFITVAFFSKIIKKSKFSSLSPTLLQLCKPFLLSTH